MSEAEKKHNESLTALEKEREELQQELTQKVSSLAQVQSQLASLEAEAEGLRHRAKALEEAVDKLQSEANQTRAELKERETEERRLCLNLEQLETDLRSSKTLMDTLQAELAEKQKRELELLEEKEHVVTQVFTFHSVLMQNCSELPRTLFFSVMILFCSVPRLWRRPGRKQTAGQKKQRDSWRREEQLCEILRRSFVKLRRMPAKAKLNWTPSQRLWDPCRMIGTG